MRLPDDENMRFNELTNQWVLTEQSLIAQGIDLRSRLASRKATSPELIINRLLNMTSELIYAYVHQFNVNNEMQDSILAVAPSARNIIFRALSMQAIYLLYVGVQSFSTDEKKRAMAVDETAKTILSTPIREIGTSILYTGV